MSLRLLCLTAHPDDEAGAFGGLLLRAADQGAETSVLCLTEGAAGSYRQPGQTDEALAGMRRKEFALSCDMLGVRRHGLLQYPDGGLWKEPFLPIVGEIARWIRSFQPHVVVTFGGDGGVNQHRDHTIVSLASTAAFHWAGRSSFFPEQLDELKPWASQKLYYSATHFHSVTDQELKRSSTLAPPSLRFELSAALQERKFAAFAAHTSQLGVLTRVQKEYDCHLSREDYLLVAAQQPVENEKDIWAGIVVESGEQAPQA